MKKTVLIAFLTLFSVSCTKKVEATAIPKLNGYWEIEKVVFPDGNQKKYSINETFEYFQIKNNQGIRKKVTPQFNGTFLVNNDFEKVAITEVNGKFYINYSTSYAKWKEELVAISDEELVVLNDSKKEYHYKRAAPINLVGDGKKTQ
jgi:hypothetical protein